ncbi:hypothetical protein [Microcoleus sp. CAWBG58]|uniref:hypothetical protein n=1 Tax=Microcoleus sp. CAWBG58 TaxID=2841651 RepID=UPI0025F4518F|nr:hypothetical protein [Microcoleus sp. CAWBG58]
MTKTQHLFNLLGWEGLKSLLRTVLRTVILPEIIGWKLEPFEGVIKIRLLITPILFFLGRGFSQTVNCQLSTVNCWTKQTIR